MRFDSDLQGDAVELLGFNWWRGRTSAQIQAQDRAKEAQQAASVASQLDQAQAANASVAAVRAQQLAVAQENARARAQKAADLAAIAAANAPAPVDSTPVDSTTTQTPDTTAQDGTSPDTAGEYYGFDFQKNAPYIGVAALAAFFLFGKKIKKVLKIR